MRYSVRRIGLSSAARSGCLLGSLFALLPALALAGVAVTVLGGVHDALHQVEPITLNVLGQELLRVDLLDALRLQSIAHTLDTWLTSPPLLFAGLSLAILLVSGLFFALSGAVLGAAYNALAGAGLGVSLELRPEPPNHRPESEQPHALQHP